MAASVSVRPDGLHEDLTDPAEQAASTRMPTLQDFTDFQQAYARLSLTRSISTTSSPPCPSPTLTPKGWSDHQLAAIGARVLLVLGDRDFTAVEHGALMQQLIPGSQLAVLPDTTHMQMTRRSDLLPPMLDHFLD